MKGAIGRWIERLFGGDDEDERPLKAKPLLEQSDKGTIGAKKGIAKIGAASLRKNNTADHDRADLVSSTIPAVEQGTTIELSTQVAANEHAAVANPNAVASHQNPASFHPDSDWFSSDKSDIDTRIVSEPEGQKFSQAEAATSVWDGFEFPEQAHQQSGREEAATTPEIDEFPTEGDTSNHELADEAGFFDANPTPSCEVAPPTDLAAAISSKAVHDDSDQITLDRIKGAKRPSLPAQQDPFSFDDWGDTTPSNSGSGRDLRGYAATEQWFAEAENHSADPPYALNRIASNSSNSIADDRDANGGFRFLERTDWRIGRLATEILEELDLYTKVSREQGLHIVIELLREFPHPSSQAAIIRLAARTGSLSTLLDSAELIRLWRASPHLWRRKSYNWMQRQSHITIDYRRGPSMMTWRAASELLREREVEELGEDLEGEWLDKWIASADPHRNYPLYIDFARSIAKLRYANWHQEEVYSFRSTSVYDHSTSAWYH